MKEIIAQVYAESDYSVFRRLPDNRDVTTSRVGKLIASMTEKYILNPIIVNEKMEVIDGQGRFEARKAMQLPIHYILIPGLTSDDCRRMNFYNTAWKALDFAKSYAKRGLSSYVTLLETCEETGKPISTILRLSGKSSKGDSKSLTKKASTFESGRLNFTQKDKDAVKDVLAKIDEIREALQFTARLNEAFTTAVKIMTETIGYDHRHMISSCEKNRSTFSQMSRLEAQLVEFERIYNKNVRAEKKLYFSDYMRNRGANVRDYGAVNTEYHAKDISTLGAN